MKTYNVGIIGLGNMGFGYLKTLANSPRWQVKVVCDLDETVLAKAKQLCPQTMCTKQAQDIFSNPDIDVVGIFTLADIRSGFVRQALVNGKHVLAEKPLAGDLETEAELLEEIEGSDRIVAVNLFNRNAWYHEEMQEFIRRGEIGELAALVLNHQTAGMMPMQGHHPEGPPFHDCGMHYVDVACWYANSEISHWHAQGLRMWDWKDPWWVNAHGHFENGITFTITQSFGYGQMSETRINRCGLDVIGTKGVVRMEHDLYKVKIEYHGIHETRVKEALYGGKKLDVLCERFVKALDTGDAGDLPTARDSVIASKLSQQMLDQASASHCPSVGQMSEMTEIMNYQNVRKQKRRAERLANKEAC